MSRHQESPGFSRGEEVKPLNHVIAGSLGWTYPLPKKPAPGVCVWCSTYTGTLCYPVPSGFAQWRLLGDTVDGARAGMCPACAAVLKAVKPVRWDHVIVDGDTAVMSPDPTVLLAALSSPVGPERAVLVQTNRLKRSALSARWGVVATCYDGVALDWDRGDAERVVAHDRLRWVHGVSEVEITEAAPRPGTLARSPDPAELLDLWGVVRGGWSGVHLEVSCLATRRPKS